MNCGKSALMSCLVGGDTIDKGQIWVLGGPPRTKSSKALTNNVGYMPQVPYTNVELRTVSIIYML